VKAKDIEQNTPLNIARHYNNYEIEKFLIEYEIRKQQRLRLKKEQDEWNAAEKKRVEEEERLRKLTCSHH